MKEDEMMRHPAFREGALAEADGLARDANPYMPETESGWLWDEGWQYVRRFDQGVGRARRAAA